MSCPCFLPYSDAVAHLGQIGATAGALLLLESPAGEAALALYASPQLRTTQALLVGLGALTGPGLPTAAGATLAKAIRGSVKVCE